MKLFKRADFILLPEKTIYSRIDSKSALFWQGLYCKTSGSDWLPDFVEQELICNPATPEELKDGGDQHYWIEEKINSFSEIHNDLDCSGRDGMFDDSDMFIVWDKTDITNLIEYLQKCI